MKASKLFPLLLVAIWLSVSACSKTIMENQSSGEKEPETVAQSEPQPQAAEPAPTPEPEADDTDGEGLDQFTATHIYFEFDSAVLRDDARDLLRVKAQWLQNHPGIAVVRIEGHCDERGTEAYNLALGAKRAETVKRYMTDMGIDAVKLETLSFGEEKPANPAKTETAWSLNRRACFVISQ